MKLRENVVWRAYDGRVVTNLTEACHGFLPMTFCSLDLKTRCSTLAMIDTGHSNAEVSGRIIEMLDLPVTGSMPVHGNLGLTTRAQFDGIAFVSSIPGAAVRLPVLELMHPIGFDGAEAIVGMSFLSFGSLLLQGPGRESFFQFLPDRLSPP